MYGVLGICEQNEYKVTVTSEIEKHDKVSKKNASAAKLRPDRKLRNSMHRRNKKGYFMAFRHLEAYFSFTAGNKPVDTEIFMKLY